MVRGHTTFPPAVRRRRGGPRCAGPHSTVLRPPGWQPAMCRHPPPARLSGRGRQYSHHAQRGHHPQHYRHAQPEAPEQRCQLGSRGHHDRAGIVAQPRERHPSPLRGPGTTTPGDHWTDVPTHLSSPHPVPREHFLPPRGHSPARLPGDTNSPPSPQRGMETLAHHAPTSQLPYLDCPGSTCWVFVGGHSLYGLQGAWICWLMPHRGGEKIQSCLRSTIGWPEPKPRLAPGATPHQREGLVCGRLALGLGTNLGTPPLPC